MGSCEGDQGVGSTIIYDSRQIGTWNVVKNAPDCETNKLLQPMGEFWGEHENVFV